MKQSQKRLRQSPGAPPCAFPIRHIVLFSASLGRAMGYGHWHADALIRAGATVFGFDVGPRSRLKLVGEGGQSRRVAQAGARADCWRLSLVAPIWTARSKRCFFGCRRHRRHICARGAVNHRLPDHRSPTRRVALATTLRGTRPALSSDVVDFRRSRQGGRASALLR